MDRPNPVPSPAGLVVKNGLNIFSSHLGRDTGSVVADPDFGAAAKVFGGRSQGRIVVASVGFRFFALGSACLSAGSSRTHVLGEMHALKGLLHFIDQLD
jgi:hypothetical protein